MFFSLLPPSPPILMVPHKNYDQYWNLTQRIFSLFTFLNFFIQIFSHFLVLLASHLPCPSYFTLFRLYKCILACSLCYWGKNIIVYPIWKLLPNSSLHTWKKSLSDQSFKTCQGYVLSHSVVLKREIIQCVKGKYS